MEGAVIINEFVQADEKTRRLFWPPITREEWVETETNARADEERRQILVGRLMSLFQERPLIRKKYLQVSQEELGRFWLEVAREWAQHLAMKEQCKEAEDGNGGWHGEHQQR